MDSVRFGRALGIGARSAAKALAGAVDAAIAPNPAKPRTASRTSTPSPIASAAQSAAKTVASAAIQADAARKGLARGGKRFGDSAWGPFARLSGVLWLEITGSFFGIFALFAASAVWSHRADLLSASHATRDARLHLLVFLVMALVFGYFSVSSFVRAYRR